VQALLTTHRESQQNRLVQPRMRCIPSPNLLFINLSGKLIVSLETNSNEALPAAALVAAPTPVATPPAAAGAPAKAPAVGSAAALQPAVSAGG